METVLIVLAAIAGLKLAKILVVDLGELRMRTASADGDQWDDPKFLKPGDCDELGYCVHCGTATIHRDGCIANDGGI